MKRIELIPETIDPSLFNSAASHPLQSFEWGSARQKMGIEVVRIGEYEDTALTAVFQMTLHAIPATAYKIGYIPRSVAPSKEVIEFLTEFGKKNNLIFIKMEPYVKKTDGFTIHSPKIVSSPHPLFPEWTQILDLTPSEDDLLKNCKSKTRYNIRLAERKGVVVKEESTDEGFEKFIKLYFDTTKRQQYYGHTKEYHQTIWNHLKSSMAHILIAYYENEPLAAYELFHFHDRLYYPYGGSSEKHRDLMASNLLMWEAIRLGKKLNATSFDMWGSLPEGYDPQNPWSGFTRFKEGYSTQFVQYIGSYDLITAPLLYKLYNTSHTLRGMYLKIRASIQ